MENKNTEKRIEADIVKIMVCNKCNSDLQFCQSDQTHDEPFLKCKGCGKEFKTIGGIIIME